MADDGGGDQGLTDEQITRRFSDLDGKVDRIGGTLDKVLGLLGGGGDAPSGGGAGKPGSAAADIAGQVRAELARADADKAAADKEAGRDTTLAEMKAQLARMQEQPPAPPQRRVERIMGWHG